jgi:hypothetical protein
VEPTQTPEQLKEEVERLNEAIGMESIQIAEQLKERLTELFISIRDLIVQFGNLVGQIQDTTIRSSTPSEIIGQNNLLFLQLIYPKITRAISQVDEIIKGVFAEPFDRWVQANITRINEIARPILNEVNEEGISQDLRRLKELKESHYNSPSGLSEEEWREYESIKDRNKVLRSELLRTKSILDGYNQDLFFDEVLTTESNRILEKVRSLLNDVYQIIDFQIP